jgi:hypothetical protein
VAATNERFRNGRPSSVLAEAGVLIHQFDGFELYGQPWRPGWGGSMLDACQPTCPPGAHATCWECDQPGDRASASLIYAGERTRDDRWAIPLFSSEGGVVLNPHRAAILCAYSGDGSTQSKVCHPPGVHRATKKHPACVPGCTHDQGYCNGAADELIFGWCRCSLGFCQGQKQAWEPSDLAKMMRQFQVYGDTYNPAHGDGSGYNEIVVDGQQWDAALPGVIEAFFSVSSGGDATAAHAAFLSTYSLTNVNVPHMRLQPSRWEAPFELV